MSIIVHLSDIHLFNKVSNDYIGGYTAERFEKILENLTLLIPINVRNSYTILITGDLVDYGSEENFLKAKFYIDRIRHEYGFKLILIPGNHDYSPTKNYRRVSNKLRKDFKAIFYGDPFYSFPFVDFSEDKSIAFIGLDSLEGEFKSYYKKYLGDGSFGRDQFQRLETLLFDKKHPKNADVLNAPYRVICFHHHPWNSGLGHNLAGFKEFYHDILLRCKEENIIIDALLYGHKHSRQKSVGFNANGLITYDNVFYPDTTVQKVLRCYDAGSTTRVAGSPGYHRFIDLSKPPLFDYSANLHPNYGELLHPL